MFDSYVTVLGTVLSTPERRRTKNNAAVANFRIASHPRRFDRESQDWVDAPSLRIRVNCWRRLAEHVCGSVFSGDPVVVYGRVVTRDWVTDQGEQRVSYEIEAISVGHDLGRGTGVFTRARPEPAGTVVEDPDALSPSDTLAPKSGGGRGVSGVDSDAAFEDFGVIDGPSTVDAMAIIAAAGLETSPGGDEDDTDDSDEGEEKAGDVAGRARRRDRQPVGV